MPSENVHHHPIIFLISLPRSNSTVFLRMMQSRGDMEVVNEPGVYAYHQNLPHAQEQGELTKKLHDDGHATYDDVINYITELSEKKSVFVKELAFAARGYLKPGCPLLLEKMFVFFLIAKPAQYHCLSL